VDRKPFLEEVSKEHKLSHVDSPADRSEPSIPYIVLFFVISLSLLLVIIVDFVHKSKLTRS